MAIDYGMPVEGYLAGLKYELINAVDGVHKAAVQAELAAVTAVSGVAAAVEADVAAVEAVVVADLGKK